MNFRVPLVHCLIIGALFVAAHSFAAMVTMPKVFGDHMALQRERSVPVWGWAKPGEKITVEFAGQCKKTITGADGRWEVRLGPMPACSQGEILRVSGANTNIIEFKDVVVGEVWLCSGQSNMNANMDRVKATNDIALADLPDLRFFTVAQVMASSPKQDVTAALPWTVCSVRTAGKCTAVGFYFARRLHSELGVPVGLIHCSWGGRIIEPWTPMEAFDAVPELAEYISAFRNAPDAANMKPTDKPAVFYNAMVYPMIPYAIHGAIWYQGETSVGNPLYFYNMRALVGGWRRAWSQGNFPFYYVQLANYQSDTREPAGGDGWTLLRDCQFKSLSITNTGMAVAIDIGEAKDIHPLNKFDVGERLARWALARDYGQTNLVPSGPLYREMKIEGNRVRLFFDHLGGGLMAGQKTGREPVCEIKDGKLKRFAVAGEDKKWFWADAVIDGDTVLVSSPNAPNPVAVRYAYSTNPEGCNLYNRAGLPASPFRTDEW